MKRITKFFFGLFLIAGIINAQSTFDKVLYDFNLEPSNSYGVHGVAVAPDGNVWVALFGAMTGDTIFTPQGDTLDMRPVYVLDPNTGDHVSFSPIRFLEWDDGRIDTLINSARGIEVDNNGNLLITGLLGSNTVVRIDYKTGKPIDFLTAPNTGSLTEAVQSPADGNIYVSHVVPGGKPIYIFDADLNYLGNAVDSFFNINRTLEISADGKDLYTGSIYNGVGIRHFHSDIPGLIPFTHVSDFGNFTNVQVGDTVYDEIKLWPSCLDFGPDGILWAGMLDDGESSGHGKGSQWYGFDVSRKMLVSTIGDPLGDKNAGGFFRPRGAAWSPDGTKMYLADFNYNNVVVYNYEPYVPDSTNLSVTFEAGENGADWTWTTFGPDNAPLAIIPNPDMTEPNTSSTVLQFTASFPGDPWAGFFSDDIGEFTFDATNSLVKVMVWKPVISNFGVKFEGASPAVEKLIPNTVTGAWEELTYDFSDQIGNTFNRLVFLPDFGPDARTQNNVIYIDNLTFSDISTDIDVLPNILPNGYSLDQNYPNPFNPTTQIRFQLKNQEDVTLKVYNMLGQEVATLLNEKMSAGVYDVKFDASQLSSGIYVYTLKAGKFFDSKKMTLLK